LLISITRVSVTKSMDDLLEYLQRTRRRVPCQSLVYFSRFYTSNHPWDILRRVIAQVQLEIARYGVSTLTTDVLHLL
jgi:hypothetical protein